MRPPSYEWVLPSAFTSQQFDAVATRGAYNVGASIEFAGTAGTGIRTAALRLTPEKMRAALTRYNQTAEELDPPDGEDYILELGLIPKDEEYPSPRFASDPDAADNWAAWALVGPLSDDVAEDLGGTEITGDPPPWLSEEIERSEPDLPAQLPYLAIRSSALFPGHCTVLNFGRPESTQAIRNYVSDGVEVFAALMQADPALENPSARGDFLAVGMAMRILRVVDHDHEIILIAKGVGRIRVGQLIGGGGARHVSFSVMNDPDGVSGSVDDLRRIARYDPMIAASAGVSLVARSGSFAPGNLCDFIAAHGFNHDAYRETLQAVNIDERIRVVREFFVANDE